MDDTTSNLIGTSCFEKRVGNPEWLKMRDDIFNKVAERRAEEMKGKKNVPITVTMPDGKVMDKDKEGESFVAWKTSPYHVAATISQGLADSAVVARVTYENYVEDYNLAEDGMDGGDILDEAMDMEHDDEGGDGKSMLWDLTRPLVGNVSKLELLKFDSEDGKTVFWHSSAHMLGETLEHLYGVRLTIGPPLKQGFFYDSYMGTDAYNDGDCKFKVKVRESPLFSFSQHVFILPMCIFVSFLR